MGDGWIDRSGSDERLSLGHQPARGRETERKQWTRHFEHFPRSASSSVCKCVKEMGLSTDERHFEDLFVVQDANSQCAVG
jgi:hypothetical protein